MNRYQDLIFLKINLRKFFNVQSQKILFINPNKNFFFFYCFFIFIKINNNKSLFNNKIK